MAGKREKEPEAVRIGGRVRLARQARGMTIEMLAEAAETSYQFLSQVEKGEQSMTAVKFGRLAKALGVSSDYLLFGRPPAEDRIALAAEYLSALNPVEQDLVTRQIFLLRRLLDELAPENERA